MTAPVPHALFARGSGHRGLDDLDGLLTSHGADQHREANDRQCAHGQTGEEQAIGVNRNSSAIARRCARER